jgi:hypothetical protein
MLEATVELATAACFDQDDVSFSFSLLIVDRFALR